MWDLDYKEIWALKNWCFWNVVLKTLESPLDCKEIQPVNPKGNQSWIFIGRTDAEAKIPILWPPDAKNWLAGKDPCARKDCRQEKRRTEDEIVGWHHRLNGHEFEQTLCVQGNPACCSPQGCEELDTTKQLSWTDNKKPPGGSYGKNPTMQDTWIQSLDWEDPLQKRVATHSSILAWRIPWTEETGGLQSKKL